MHYFGRAYSKLTRHQQKMQKNFIQLECSHNYSIKSGSLWKYYRDKINDVDVNKSTLDGKTL